MPTGHAPGGSFASGLAAPRGGHVPGAGAIRFSEDAFVSQRGDHLGMTLAERRATLESRLVQGVVLYAGLWLELPDRTGAGGREVADANYQRVAVSRWLNRIEGASVRRTAAVATLWDAFAEAQEIVGWGIWTAATAGTLRFFDHIRTAGEDREPVTRTVPAGSRFGIGAGANGIGLVL